MRPRLLRPLAVAALSPLVGRLSPDRMARLLESVPRGGPDGRAPADAERALALSGRLMRHTCYTRGITRFVTLRRAGFDVALVFGVDTRPDGLGGHCWIELESAVYREVEDPLERFAPVWRIPRAPSSGASSEAGSRPSPRPEEEDPGSL